VYFLEKTMPKGKRISASLKAQIVLEDWRWVQGCLPIVFEHSPEKEEWISSE
jgi:hypothetical protein